MKAHTPIIQHEDSKSWHGRLAAAPVVQKPTTTTLSLEYQGHEAHNDCHELRAREGDHLLAATRRRRIRPHWDVETATYTASIRDQRISIGIWIQTRTKSEEEEGRSSSEVVVMVQVVARPNRRPSASALRCSTDPFMQALEHGRSPIPLKSSLVLMSSSVLASMALRAPSPSCSNRDPSTPSSTFTQLSLESPSSIATTTTTHSTDGEIEMLEHVCIYFRLCTQANFKSSAVSCFVVWKRKVRTVLSRRRNVSSYRPQPRVAPQLKMLPTTSSQI